MLVKEYRVCTPLTAEEGVEVVRNQPHQPPQAPTEPAGSPKNASTSPVLLPAQVLHPHRDQVRGRVGGQRERMTMEEVRR